MRAAPAVLLLALAAGAAARAGGQPTAVPTSAGAGAVTPSDQTAVRPALPDERANRTVELGSAPPTPAPLPVAAPTPAAAAPPQGAVEEPGRSEPDTGTSPAAPGSVHRKPGVAGRPVSVARALPYTVVAFEPGRSLTLRRPEGTAVAFSLAKKAEVPKGLAPGQTVTIRTKTVHGKRVVTRVQRAGETKVLTNVD